MALRPSAISEDAAHAVDFDGFNVYESGGAASTVIEFRDGAVDGTLLLSVPLAAGEGATLIFPEAMEVTHADGVFVKTTGTGVVTGVLYSRID